VTVTGTGCPVGHWGEPDVDPDRIPAIFNTTSGRFRVESWFFTSTGDFAGGTVGRDGRWTMTATVPMVPPGQAEIVGSCAPTQGSRGAQIEFHYPGVSVTVSSPFRLEVEPSTTVKAGTRLTLSPLGGKCPYLSGSNPEVHLYSGLDVSLSDGDSHPVSTPSGWKSFLVVPVALQPGEYTLEADCTDYFGGVDGTYSPVVITVR
jgi:hypothetical protein